MINSVFKSSLFNLTEKTGFGMSNLNKGFYAGMPRNGHLESKTPHCALVLKEQSIISLSNRVDLSGTPCIPRFACAGYKVIDLQERNLEVDLNKGLI